MTDQELNGGNQPPEDNKSGAPANPSEPNESDDIEFTPEQKRKLGKIISAERKAERKTVAAQFKDYDDLKKKIQEIEDAKLSESERLQKEKEEAIKERDAIKNQLADFGAKELRINMYSEYKTKDGQSLPIGLMKYVTGTDEKSIAASIESIAADFGAKVEKRKNIGNSTPAGTEAVPNKNAFMNDQIMAVAGRGGR
jgi:alanyl-tRNA synthetase